MRLPIRIAIGAVCLVAFYYLVMMLTNSFKH